MGGPQGRREGDFRKEGAAQKGRKSICCFQKADERKSNARNRKYMIEQMLLAAQGSDKHVVTGKPQTTSCHTTGTTHHYYVFLMPWLTKYLMHMNKPLKLMIKVLCIKELINGISVTHFAVALEPEDAEDHPCLDYSDQVLRQIFHCILQYSSELA